jgi:hypothetical protein
MTIATHVIFTTLAQAEAAQSLVFERLQGLIQLSENTTAFDDVMLYGEGYGFASPRTSIYSEYADDLLAGFENNEMNATLVQIED